MLEHGLLQLLGGDAPTRAPLFAHPTCGPAIVVAVGPNSLGIEPEASLVLFFAPVVGADGGTHEVSESHDDGQITLEFVFESESSVRYLWKVVM